MQVNQEVIYRTELIRSLAVQLSVRIDAAVDAARNLTPDPSTFETRAGFAFRCEINDLDSEAVIAAWWLGETWFKNRGKIATNMQAHFTNWRNEILEAWLGNLKQATCHWLKAYRLMYATKEELQWPQR